MKTRILAIGATLLAVALVLVGFSGTATAAKGGKPKPTPSPTVTTTPKPILYKAFISGYCDFPFPEGVVAVFLQNNTFQAADFTVAETLNGFTTSTVYTVPGGTTADEGETTVGNFPYRFVVTVAGKVIADVSGQLDCEVSGASAVSSLIKKPPKPTPTPTPTVTPTPQTLIADLQSYCQGAQGQAPAVIRPYLENDTNAAVDFTVQYLEPFTHTDVFTIPAHVFDDFGPEYNVEGVQYHVVISAQGQVLADTTGINPNC